jgi:hypothetical protein
MHEDQEDLVTVYTGTDVTARILKEYLSEIGIQSVLKSKHDTSIDKIGGCEVRILEHDQAKAASLVEEYKRNNS